VHILANLLGGGVRLLLALLLGNLLALLLRNILAVSVGNLNQFLLLDVVTGVIVVLLTGAGHLDPLLASVTVFLPPRLAVRLLLAAALCLCVRLGLLPVLLAAHLFVDSLAGVLVDRLTCLPELLDLLLVALLLCLLYILGVPDRLLCGEAGNLGGRLNNWSRHWGLHWRCCSILWLPNNQRAAHCCQ
jgi:predicted neutral ceramidase superfamily lipid hydrolase